MIKVMEMFPRIQILLMKVTAMMSLGNMMYTLCILIIILYRNASSYIEAEATCILSTSEEIRKFIKEDKYIVPLSQLLKLAHCTCSMPSCNLPVDRHITKSGAALLIKFTCPAGHCVKWTSSPSHKDSKCSSISAINLLLANSILLSGNNIAKIDMFLDFMGVASISKSSFFLYQKQYICPAIKNYWESEQSQIFSKLQSENEIILSGDGRCDSPGN